MKKSKREKVKKLVDLFVSDGKDILYVTHDAILVSQDFNRNNKGYEAYTLLVDVDNLSKNAMVVGFSKYLQTNDDKKYDLIIAELPYGWRSIKSDKFENIVQENWLVMYGLMERLTEKGLLLVCVEPHFGSSIRSKLYLEEISKYGYSVRSLMEMPQAILVPYTSLQPNIAVFAKRRDNDSIFVVSLEDTDSIKSLYSNFLVGKDNGNIAEGAIVEMANFKGFNNYRINDRIRKLQTQYKEYQQKDFNEFVKDVRTTKDVFQNYNENCLYIPRVGNMNVFSNLADLDKKQHNYFQLLINDKEANSKYLERYFSTDIGQLSLKELLSGSMIPKVNKVDLESLKVYSPDIETQEKIVASYDLLDNVVASIKEVEEELSLNPNSSVSISNRLNNTLEVLKGLSKSDKVRKLVRQGEGTKVEFKTTFSKDVEHGGEVPVKDIEKSSLKSIAGFLNKEGGTLIIGVRDNGEIFGIENDDNFRSDDKYLLRFTDIITKAFGEEFVDLIEYEIVLMDEKKVLVVDCLPSKKEVFIDGKEFYVRRNPRTIRLDGVDMVKYIEGRFREKK